MNGSTDEYHRRRLYRDSERGLIFGVCAGIAENFDWPVWLIRIGALALGWYFPTSAVVAYVVAALILPQRPLRYRGAGDERSCWQPRHHRTEP
jgi:phage shock protein C